MRLWPKGDAPQGPHGGSPGVSTGCPPRRGGLHTRCAPVRRSHPPEGGIPLDLHVLGLPLAFILSQDQTLRCSIALPFVSSLFLGFRYTPALSRGKVLPCFLLSRFAPKGLRLCAGLRLSKNLLPHPSFHPLFPSEADCKSTTILVNGNQKFQLFSIKCYILL